MFWQINRSGMPTSHPAGLLRMFNANEMPEGGKVEPLSAACLQQNHDIRSSFINIEPKHTHAAVAFSNDPWPREVLAKYKQAGAPAPRFTQVTIAGGKTATIEGAGRSLTLDPTLSALTKNVLEFATEKFPSIVGKEGQPDGAYGFIREGISGSRRRWVIRLRSYRSSTVWCMPLCWMMPSGWFRN